MFGFSKEMACLIILVLTVVSGVSAEQDLIQKRYVDHI